jgi:hypothetical protein
MGEHNHESKLLTDLLKRNAAAARKDGDLGTVSELIDVYRHESNELLAELSGLTIVGDQEREDIMLVLDLVDGKKVLAAVGNPNGDERERISTAKIATLIAKYNTLFNNLTNAQQWIVSTLIDRIQFNLLKYFLNEIEKPGALEKEPLFAIGKMGEMIARMKQRETPGAVNIGEFNDNRKGVEGKKERISKTINRDPALKEKILADPVTVDFKDITEKPKEVN